MIYKYMSAVSVGCILFQILKKIYAEILQAYIL